MELNILKDVTEDMIQLYETQRYCENELRWMEKEKERILKWNHKRKVMIVKSGAYLLFYVDNIAERDRKILTISPYKRDY